MGSTAPWDPHEAMLRLNPVVSALGDESILAMARHSVARRFVKPERIWREGDTATRFQVIVSGMVKLVGSNAGLRPTLFDVYGPGDALGYWAALDGSPYIGDAVPITAAVKTLLVPASTLVEAVERRGESALAIAHSVLTHARTLRARLSVLGAGTVDQRLALLLLDLGRRFGNPSADGSLIVPVPLSRADLAIGVGSTVETVIRAMSRWQKAAVVETHPWGFVVRDVATVQSLLQADLPRA